MLAHAVLHRCLLPLIVILGCLSVVCAVNAGAQGGGKPLGGRKGSWPYLPLLPERAARVEALQTEWAQHAQILKRRLGERTEELEQQYHSYRLDEKQIRSLEHETRDTQAQLLEMHHDFQVKLRGLLTEAEFDVLQRELQKGQDQKLKFQQKWGKPAGGPEWRPKPGMGK